MANITQVFIEKAVGKEITSFEVTSAAHIDDGYQSILYTVDVNLKKTTESEGKSSSEVRTIVTHEFESESDYDYQYKSKSTLHLLLKCYPTNPALQGFLKAGNIFRKELLVYSTFIPELIRFQRKNSNSVSFETCNQIFKKGNKFYRPPFAEFYYGRAIDYDAVSKGDTKVCEDPLENCIIMADLNKTGGFRLANSFEGFDLDHCRVVIAAQARLHALSWAYKLLTNTHSLATKFEFLGTSALDAIDEKMRGHMNEQNLNLFREAIQHCSRIDDGMRKEYLKSLERYKHVTNDVINIYFSSHTPKDNSINKDNVLRDPQPSIEDEEPWLVFTHGDAWHNNMLFRYDETSGKPLEVIFVDLQVAREGDPFADVAYNLYTSTSAQLRKDHLEDLLKLYVVTFIQVCEHFKVTPLPGFQLSEVKRRFHRAKAFGFSMSLMGLPIFLNESNNSTDLETNNEGERMELIVDNFMKLASVIKEKGNSAFAERIVELVEELYEDGVI